jgi:hypothetical protein
MAEWWENHQEIQEKLQHNQNGGIIKGFQAGGTIPGFSGGDAVPPIGPDTVPILAAPGEFVVSADAAKGNYGLLRRLNSYGASAMSPQGMQTGGIVGRGSPGGEPVGGVAIPSGEGLADAMMQLVDIAQGIRDSVDNSAEEQDRNKEGVETRKEETTNGAGASTNNINITVNVTGGAEGEATVESSHDAKNEEGEDSGDDPQKNEKFATMLKNSVIQVITEQQRPGGLLSD